MIYSFENDKKKNKQINEIYNLLKKGRSNSSIADLFNSKNVKNLFDTSEIWNGNQIANISDTFKLNTDNPILIPRKVNKILFVLSIIIALFLMLLNYSESLRLNLETGKLIGRTLGGVLVPLFIVYLFQFRKKFKNNSSKVKIFFWTALIILIIKIGGIASELQKKQILRQNSSEVQVTTSSSTQAFSSLA